MRKLLKILMIAIGSAMIIVGCGNTRKTLKDSNTEVLGSSMMTAFDFEATMTQIDSVIIADNLPKIDKWFVYSFTDYETGHVYRRYTYSVQLERGVAKYTFLIDETSPYPFKKIISK